MYNYFFKHGVSFKDGHKVTKNKMIKAKSEKVISKKERGKIKIINSFLFSNDFFLEF